MFGKQNAKFPISKKVLGARSRISNAEKVLESKMQN
jgi:hypothetical protein